jgi:transposase-like protein
MRSRRRSPGEQLRLVTECHQSGLTDFEWCQENNIKVSTFYGWVHRLKLSGKIDTPAVIPAVIARQAEQQDIVKIAIEGERQLPVAENAENKPDDEGNALPVAPLQSGCPVMEVILNGVRLRVTNGISPQLLADMIRLLRGEGC